ncbi:pentatricopeptide repeat-containing protein At2g03880, mitochondrial-like isoform X1 [Physcomitrium patens]|uniref:Pentatricopeptide repeat protein n=2 Tax=Physcomitrium patens TaxID=3218 RepID=A0A090B957_PHYPA|nr:pentatricopeptide repeat protein [Physcomitrium patens]
MDSTMQLLNSSNVSSELIDGQSGRGIIFSSFRLNEAQVQRISVGSTVLSGGQTRRSQLYSLSISGCPKGEGHKYLPSAHVCANASVDGAAEQSKNVPTAKDAVALLKIRVQQGIVIDSFSYVDILQRCLKQEDILLAKQVHVCIIKSGMEQNLYVANKLLRVYIRCGRLQCARQVFDKLVKKNIYIWTTMIGGYAEYGYAEDAMKVYSQMRREGGQPNEITYLSILKACCSPVSLKWGKKIHAHIIQSGFQSDVRVETALVNMYVKCGSIDDAQLIFDKMVERNVISWTVMIGGLAHYGRGQEAFHRFLQMQREGFIPNSYTYVSILNANASAGALEWVKEVHSHAVNAGLALDLRVGNALVHMYAKSGSIDDARVVFDGMVERDIFSWTVMIGGLAQHGRGQEAFSLFLQMERGGCLPNLTTYLSILNASAITSTGALEWVKEVHKHAGKAGFISDLRVGNALIHMYAKCGSIDDARLVFDGMCDRDVISWNAMIGGLAQNGCGHEAFTIFLKMQQEGFVPDSTTYLSLLNTHVSTGAWEWVKEVHKHAVEVGLVSDLRVGSAFVHMYIRCGSIDDAQLIFDKLAVRNVTTWNAMIGGVAQQKCGREALSLFLQMRREGFFPDATTFVNILSANVGEEALEWVKEVHSYAIDAGLVDLRVGNALVHMYAKCGNTMYAKQVFDDMVERNVTTWTVMISGLAQHGCGHEAFSLFLQMLREGIVPDATTYVSILSACASTGALEWVKEVHSHAVNAGLVSDLRVGNALVHMYAKCGSVDDARRVFDDMLERDVYSWTVMIGGLAQHGRGLDALDLFVKMKLEGFKPNGYSFVAVLSACSHAGLVDEGRRQFLSLTQDYGIEPTMEHYTCMVDLLGRAGQLEEAKHFILNMPIEPGDAPWGALLGACVTYGNLEMAEFAAKERLKLKPKSASTYVLLSNIYAATGNWEQKLLVRSMMQRRGIRKEPGRSWIEVDNQIHSFVVGDTSHPESKEIYAKLKDLIKRLKAEGYVPDTRLVLRNTDQEYKEQALCSHSEKLAIVYGLMHTPYRNPIRVYKNLRVCSDCHTATKFISKVTGREIVARDAKRFHHFKDGVCSCGDYW